MGRRGVGGAVLAGGLAALAARRLGGVPDAGWTTLVAAAIAGVALMLLLMALVARRVRTGVIGAALLALTAVGFLVAPPAPAVLLIVIDCLSAARFGPDTMPQTWAWAQEGARFDYGLAQSSWTRSAVGSMLTGQWPAVHQLYRLKPAPDRLPDAVPTLAETFAAAGYATALFAEQAQLDPAFGLARGFGRYRHRDGRAPSLQRRFFRWNLFFRHVPRFAYLHYIDIHKPYAPDPAFVPAGLPPDTLGLNSADQWADWMRAVNRGARRVTPEEWRRLEGLHLATLRQLDAALGALWDRLRSDGTLDKSWIILTADHGEAFGEHGWFTHGGTPYGELVEIPLVIRPPGGQPAARLEGHPRQVDLAPTLLDMAGLPALPGAPGRSLLPVLRGEALPEKLSFAEYYGEEHRLVGVRQGGWSLLRGPTGDRLFDLRADPREQVEVAAQHPEVYAELSTLADGYLSIGAPRPQTAGAVDAGTEAGLRALGYLE